jgi:hypothetical protein
LIVPSKQPLTASDGEVSKASGFTSVVNRGLFSAKVNSSLTTLPIGALRGMRLKEFIAQSLEKNLAGQRDDLKSRRVRLPLIRSSGGHPINLTREQVDAGIWE